MTKLGKFTIKDIASRTGLSKGTVDRVLHNRGEVSKKSYDKVMKVIEEIGYQPNVYASLLASSRNHLIAVLIPFHEPGSFWELSSAGLARAAENVKTVGVNVQKVEYDQYDLESFREACNRLVDMAPSGVVIAPMFKNETFLLTERLQQKDIPYVFIDSKLEQDGYMAYFGMPMYMSGYLCADLLVNGQAPGHAVIVRIQRDKHRQSDPTINRRAGFMDYMQEHCPDCLISNLFIDPNSPERIGEALERFFSAHSEVRHIVMFNSRIYLIVNFLEKHNLQDCRVIGFDNLSANIAALKRGTVSALIAQHPDEQVQLAVQALSDRIVLKKTPARKDHYMHMDILTKYNVEYY